MLVFLERQGPEFAALYDTTELQVEFLKDPTCWLDAHKVENFLKNVEDWCLINLNLEKPLTKIGHDAKNLKSWGVLDSVLRMIEKPNDIFLQPQRFLSYFISPPPPIANIKRGESSVSIDLPISFEEYPHVATYLCAALEAVPLYVGAEMAEANWRQNNLSVSWRQSQPLFNNSELGRQMAPDVMKNLIATLEKTEQALIAKTLELEKIKNENSLAAKSQVQPIDSIINIQQNPSVIQSQILRLQDYFTRSQQLVTLLIAQDRMTPQVREAMKRVNWDKIQNSYEQVTQEILDTLDNKPLLKKSSEMSNVKNYENQSPRDSRQPWLPHS